MTSPQVQLLFLDLTLILLAAHLFGRAARLLGQPPVVGELAGGILLGPSILGDASAVIFPTDLRPALGAVANVGIALFMLTVGHRTGGTNRPDRRTVLGVATGSMLAPAALAVPLGFWLAGRHQVHETAGFVIFIVAAMAVTAFPVLARIVADNGMVHTRIGQVALSSAAINDVVAWLLVAAAIFVQGSAEAATWRLALFPVHVATMVLLVRPLLRHVVRTAPGTGVAPVSAAVAVALLSGAATEWMGLHFAFGAFLTGLCLPSGPVRLSNGELIDGHARIADRILPLTTSLLLPVYFVVAGLAVDLRRLDISNLVELLVVLAVATGGKLLGTFVAARLSGVRPRQAATLASLMNTRGLTELVVLSIGLQLGLLDPTLYSLLVLTALITTAATGPLLVLFGRSRRSGQNGPHADDVPSDHPASPVQPSEQPQLGAGAAPTGGDGLGGQGA